MIMLKDDAAVADVLEHGIHFAVELRDYRPYPEGVEVVWIHGAKPS